MKLKAIVFLLGALLLSACGYELPKAGNTADTSTNSAVLTNQNTNNQSNSLVNAEQVNKNAGATNSKTANGNTGETKLVLIGSGESTTYPCNGREVEIEETATAISYTFTGECKKITVNGVSVTVNVDRVGEIVVTGVSNKVIYGEGIGGKKPKITKSGTSTFAETKAEAEKRKSETN
jgi:outer membrane lipopolysaccharide assembly protein LptE/RlpB